MKEHNWPIAPADKIKGNITHGAFANPMMKSVLKRFGKTAFARSSACMEFEAFLRRILNWPYGDAPTAEARKANGTCLEVGTFYGITAILLTQFFERVICVSLDVPGARDQKHEIVRHLGLEDRIRFFDVSNNADKAVLINQLDFDFCYMDGDHAHDTYTDFDLVKRCGRVLFHEFWPLQAPVHNLVMSLPRDEVTVADYDCFAYWSRKAG